MRYIRAELHNHSTHSDGEMTVAELIDYMNNIGADVFALTDHNTMSGVAQARTLLQEMQTPALLPGVELTTHFGHILVTGLAHMVDIRPLNPKRPEPFFDTLRANGAQTIGIAHPYCLGSPVTYGCRFEVQVNDWSKIDYIEVFNTSFAEQDAMGGAGSPMLEAVIGNEQALALWQRLVLEGKRLAAVTGKDIHKRPVPAEVFCTWALAEDDDARAEAVLVLHAIKTQKTLLSKGPLFTCETAPEGVHLAFAPNFGAWQCGEDEVFVLEACADTGKCVEVLTDLCEDAFVPLAGAKSAVVKLYRTNSSYQNLLAVAPPLYWN